VAADAEEGVMIYAIDPGPEQSALVVYCPAAQQVVSHQTEANDIILSQLASRVRSKADTLVIEQIASFGMPVGADVFETVFWSGRFAQAWTGYNFAMPFERVKRHEVKQHLCRSQRAKDANIRQAILDRYGSTRAIAIGTKDRKGPLYGIKGDEWAALAVALTWADTHAQKLSEAS
jgi:hypothetical protein